MAGSVLFRGSTPPRPEELTGLRPAGITVRPRRLERSEHWALDLTHPAWGDAVLVCRRDATPPPRSMIEFDRRLTDDERETIRAGESLVTLIAQGKRGDVLHDRKTALRFLRAVMADDGLAAVDHAAQAFWTRRSLDEELSHDAALDVEGVFTMHAVHSGHSNGDGNYPRVYWFHSHGLSEMGFFDFDIVNPSEDLCTMWGVDALRAVAFGIIEGRAKRSTARFVLAHPRGVIRFVPMESFIRRAAPNDRDTLDYDGQIPNRAVLCEPKGRWLGAWSKKVTPSRFLSRPLGDNLVIAFSDAASALMADRARHTYSLFRQLRDEFREFDLPAMVKLGYGVDGGRENDKEHLWFTVHETGDTTINATLENQPFNIGRMNAGDRDHHPVDRLSDWVIITPVGTITPRSLVAAHLFRSHRDELRTMLQSFKGIIDERKAHP